MDSGISENRASNCPPEANPGSPQISQTYSDFKQTLSDSKREKFLDFVRKQTKSFPQPINDLEAWLASKNKAGENRWQVYYRNFLAEQQPKEKAPKRRRLHEELEQRKRELERLEMERLASGESKVREITAPAG